MADERDACALVAVARKDGRPGREAVALVLHGLERMAHRSGEVDGEGDGAGILTDLPRELWAGVLDAKGIAGATASDPRFAVGHFFLGVDADSDAAAIRAILRGMGRILVERTGVTRSNALLRRGRAEEPPFLQVALLLRASGRRSDAALHRAETAITGGTGATVASLSRSTVVYKLRGAASQLVPYYADLGDPRFRSSMAFGHNRYSTNTSSTFTRVQPFAAFAHNGEIDTIAKLRDEARMLCLPLSRDGSDSQDVDAVLRGLVHGLGLEPIEAIELVFPPIVNEVRRMEPAWQDAYAHARASFGPFAQGPAAFLARLGDTCLFGVDAMGLRPLWHVETDGEHIFASERGFVPLETYVTDPRPLGPGEHAALERTQAGWRHLDHTALRRRFVETRARRRVDVAGARSRLETGGPAPSDRVPARVARIEVALPPDEIDDHTVRREQRLAALGYDPDDLRAATFMAQTGNEPIGSLGYDGPLAALSTRRVNLADHLHETVAVVTNPAIDREREIEHFSTRVHVGPRPAPHRTARRRAWIELSQPLLVGGHDATAGLGPSDARDLARSLGTWVLDDLVERLVRDARRPCVTVECDRDWNEPLRDALTRLGAQACAGVRAGSRVVLIQDRAVIEEGRSWIDPMLVTATVQRALSSAPATNGSLRRDCAVLLQAGSLRNLHDVMVALGSGADAVAPYLLLEHAISTGDPHAPANLFEALRKGIEKVISTLGMHELRGYGRAYSAIGLAPEAARALGVRTFAASDERGIGWTALEEDGFDRARMLRERTPARLEPAFRLYPRVWKAALATANGEAPYSAYAEKLEALEREHPISLRHLLDLRAAVTPGITASTNTGEHAAPFYISSMSFGSQGETAYRAYAEAASRMDILCINGEGGELPDLLGRYPRNRGQQIASGRFGVSALLANSSDYLEIKIGQGAKPGEGGHLPGRKVSAKVALARNATPGVDLISPSNNHDIYSIEDLAQVIHELKTVNPRARVAVKIPVTPEVGIIACGVAKAGADIVTLSGYDGGTGAARLHALRRAGLPAEIGVSEAHRALIENGLRDRVELWCDGGMRSAADVVKMLCLGAERVGFGTLAMVAIGCTICRGCQLDTCHVGIATQIETQVEAAERGLKRFEPQELERAVTNLCRFFGALRAEIALLAGALGVASVRELVGRTDLLVQARGLDRVDLADLLRSAGTDGAAAAATLPQGRPALSLGRASPPAPRGESPQWAGSPSFPSRESGARPLDIAAATDDEQRVLATAISGAIARERIAARESTRSNGSHSGVAGNGLAAYMTDGIGMEVAGGAQDGAAKTALGGTLAVLKGPNATGRFVDGGVGKAFAYGAQRGRMFVQGCADARAAIRLSGAEIVFGGDLGGFAFEYMTGGTAIVLGDPGRWICSGMSGGLVFLRLDPGAGLDEAGLRARFAKGAKVTLRVPADAEAAVCAELLGAYAATIASSGQHAEAARIRDLRDRVGEAFRVVRPGQEQVDQTVSTE